jgi:hypothetical protein
VTETAWPALIAALRRAENAGCDPAAALSSAATTRELRTARSISEVLAWRIGRHLAATGSPDRGDSAASTPAAGLLPWVASPPIPSPAIVPRG